LCGIVRGGGKAKDAVLLNGFCPKKRILGFGLGFCQWEVYFVLSCLGYLLKSILSCSTTWFHGFREGGLSFGFLADKQRSFLFLSFF